MHPIPLGVDKSCCIFDATTSHAPAQWGVSRGRTVDTLNQVVRIDDLRERLTSERTSFRVCQTVRPLDTPLLSPLHAQQPHSHRLVGRKLLEVVEWLKLTRSVPSLKRTGKQPVGYPGILG